MRLEVGQPAPLIKVQDSFGKPVDFAELVGQGKRILLWFYPKANSGGCTAQGKYYADLHPAFRDRGVEVFGVSADPASSQCAFIDKLSTEGAMLPDADHSIGKAFGVSGWMGFGLMLGMYSRDTILIGSDGRVEQIWRNVNPFTDAKTVLAYLEAKPEAYGAEPSKLKVGGV
ncbi:MAG: peroxiredoxin [Meiothermus sp.]|nr:peroxiredoxin [Meiothermus sp.]